MEEFQQILVTGFCKQNTLKVVLKNNYIKKDFFFSYVILCFFSMCHQPKENVRGFLWFLFYDMKLLERKTKRQKRKLEADEYHEFTVDIKNVICQWDFIFKYKLVILWPEVIKPTITHSIQNCRKSGHRAIWETLT